MNKPESPLYALSFGYSLAMRVMQSDLYPSLDGAERAECDELIARGQSAVPSEQPIAEQPQAEQPDSVYLGSAGPSEDLQTALSELRRAVRTAWLTGTDDFRHQYDSALFAALGISSFQDLYTHDENHVTPRKEN